MVPAGEVELDARSYRPDAWPACPRALEPSRRNVRRLVNFGGLARLTTVQTSNLYAFSKPSPTAPLLPIKRRIRNDAARLVAKLAKAFSFRTGSAERTETNSRGFQIGASTVETPIGAENPKAGLIR